MSKTFRPWTIDQPLLLPARVQDFVGEDHLARFVLALVLDHLDLREIEAAYGSERGQRLDSGAKRNEVKRSGFGRPFQAGPARLGMAS